MRVCYVGTMVENTLEHGGNVNVRVCYVGTMVENTLGHGGNVNVRVCWVGAMMGNTPEHGGGMLTSRHRVNSTPREFALCQRSLARTGSTSRISSGNVSILWSFP